MRPAIAFLVPRSGEISMLDAVEAESTVALCQILARNPVVADPWELSNAIEAGLGMTPGTTASRRPRSVLVRPRGIIHIGPSLRSL